MNSFERQIELPTSGESSFYLGMYSRYLRDRNSVPADWAVYFGSLGDTEVGSGEHAQLLAQILHDRFRAYGHFSARLDPLARADAILAPEIDWIRKRALESTQILAALSLGRRRREATPASLLAELEQIYGSEIAIEGWHLPEPERSWIFDTFEAEVLNGEDPDSLVRAIRSVILIDEFEAFLARRYPTKKRFGLEGAEGAAAFVGEILFQAGADGADELIIGGMHRGRLSLLAAVVGKPLPTLMGELSGNLSCRWKGSRTGDVAYHLGSSSTVRVAERDLRVSVLPHPSHLSVVSAVAVGAARARQRSSGDRSKTIPLLLHTDAAFSGQGIISELLQLGGLEGYSVGGSIHLVVNNHIGFTTSTKEGRSTYYCSDVAKSFGIPVLHVNGDSPAAITQAARIALAWRQAKNRDIIVDLSCYRRNGHNELDEPRFTQPDFWAAIDEHPPLRQLISQQYGASYRDDLESIEIEARDFREKLQSAATPVTPISDLDPDYSQVPWSHDDRAVNAHPDGTTGVHLEVLRKLGELTSKLPTSFAAHGKVRRFYEQRQASILRGEGINFATAEALAFAVLLDENVSIRLSGQDCVRGTFTQRHLFVYDQKGEVVVPLRAACKASRFEAINSPLAEYSVVAFEYGHTLPGTDVLTIWEAQFGDFINVAQVVIDQFVVSAEAKWQLNSNLVLSLPHGLEGQGPDHSSARIERILQLCVDDNVRVIQPSTPANLFHALRQQLSSSRKPLFLISPKSLLRHPDCVSHLADMDRGTEFQSVLTSIPVDTGIRRLIFCSGKIYYDLQRKLAELALDVGLVRIEQLYPFPIEQVLELVNSNRSELIWCQEEPENQGAWPFIKTNIAPLFPRMLRFVGRPAMAAAAEGSFVDHEIQQARLVMDALK